MTTPAPNLAESCDSLISCENSQGVEIRASIVQLTRHLVVFEVYSPFPVLRLSEAMTNFRILLGERAVYVGRAVVTNLVNAGAVAVCEATLEDSWLDVDMGADQKSESSWKADFTQFMQSSQNAFRVRPEFKLVVADMQVMLQDLRRWLEQVELGILSQPSGSRLEFERNILAKLQEPILPLLGTLFEKFEVASESIEVDSQPAHRAYVKRQLHSIVLCAPFMYRTFAKPLGYAGDYEMVNMMVRDPREGASVFAKMLNTFFLSTPPVVAHRNRIDRLKTTLTRELARGAATGTTAKVFNIGCGPAKEIQEFIAESDLSARAQFVLLDFNEETLGYTGQALNEVMKRCHRRVSVQLVKKSVAQLLKDAGKPNSTILVAGYDLVYCAGLFDYLPDYVCEKLMAVFYKMVAPGGLLLVTNVEGTHTSRGWMEYAVDWHLIYRNYERMAKLRPSEASPDDCHIYSESSGVNIFMEVRKPVNA